MPQLREKRGIEYIVYSREEEVFVMEKLSKYSSGWWGWCHNSSYPRTKDDLSSIHN